MVETGVHRTGSRALNARNSDVDLYAVDDVLPHVAEIDAPINPTMNIHLCKNYQASDWLPNRLQGE